MATVTKRDLVTMRDSLRKTGGANPDGLDALIERFDQAAGGGRMTIKQFKVFAAENAAPAPAAATPAATPAAKAADVVFESDGQLKLKATQGDPPANHELERRALAKGEAPAALD
jgi:hypothetical protein